MTDEEIEEMIGEDSDLSMTTEELLAVAEKDKAALIQQTIDLRNELEEAKACEERMRKRLQRQSSAVNAFITAWRSAGMPEGDEP